MDALKDYFINGGFQMFIYLRKATSLIMSALLITSIISIVGATNEEKNIIQSETFDSATSWDYEEDEANQFMHYVDLTDNNEKARIKSIAPNKAAINNMSDGDSPKSSYSAIDNSLNSAFPSIKSQYSVGSCAAFSTVYYQYTYYVNKMKGLSSASLTN